MYFISATLLFILWAGFVIYTYYTGGTLGIAHTPESIDGITGYLVILLIVYALYKSWQIMTQKKNVRFHLGHIVGFALAHVLILSFVFFTLSSVKDYIPESLSATIQSGGGLTLFLGICGYLLVPTFLTFLARSLGFTLLTYILPLFSVTQWKNEDFRLRLPTETAIGYGVMSLLLLGVGMMGFYTHIGILSVILILTVLSYVGWKECWYDIRTRRAEFEGHDLTSGRLSHVLAPRLLSAEIFYIFITFLIAVSLINIYRPMPIGWDDLGVYMNFPKIMALNESVLQGAGIYAWQILTSIGFFIGNSATQAFFINQIGGILSIIAIGMGTSLLLEEKGKKSLLALPIIFAGIFYSMSMVVFQQAKDMKLDPALMFFSVVAVTLLMILLRRMRGEGVPEDEKKSHTGISPLALVMILAIVIGFAFTVKITTLMLILAAFAVLCYRMFGYGGYVGFFFLFVALFTKLHLWDQLNVVYEDDPTWVNTVFAGSGFLAIISFGFGIVRHGFSLSRTSLLIGMLVLALPVLPWFAKNVSESKSLSTSALLYGSGGTFRPDYSLIYTEAELKAIEAQSVTTLSSSGQAGNEDMGRYFGYEMGINNYLKLPSNLTFQKNQSGEYTDISFLYLALLPVILLFIPGRRYRFALFVGVVMLMMIAFYLFPPTQEFLTTFFGTQNLPKGYLWIFGLFVLASLAPVLLLDNTKRHRNFQDITLFTAFYGLIFAISAFGIVWYGITFYYGLLIMIGFGALSFLHYDSEDEQSGERMILKGTMTGVFFLVILVHFLLWALPHGWNNYKNANFPVFKAGITKQETAIFNAHADYLVPLATMNLRDPSRAIERAKALVSTDRLKDLVSQGYLDTLDAINGLANYALYNTQIQSDPELRNEIGTLSQQFYSDVLYPSRAEANTGKIYRIGTFMTYFISNNRERYLDDSLVMAFGKYFYDAVPEVATNRMKTLGIRYFLIDLNAATIDRDPRHDLTARMDNLLSTFRANNLRLVATDSICLRFGLDQYKQGLIETEEFLVLAGVNSESYTDDSVRTRSAKQNYCYNKITEELSSSDWQTYYPYLSEAQSGFPGAGYYALFEITDAPTYTRPVTTSSTVSSSTGATASGSTSAQ